MFIQCHLQLGSFLKGHQRDRVEHARLGPSIPFLINIYVSDIEFRLNSEMPIPSALPLAYINPVSQVEPVVIPAGKAVTCCAYRTL